jgi:endo-1,3-1,4-beta-glycanase ExoK
MTKTLERLRRIARAGLEAARPGWIAFRNSWTQKDWLAGIEPLPPGMAPHLAALAIVTGLVMTSLVYGDYYQRRMMEARLIPSGEHPSQQEMLPPGASETAPEPVPIPATPAPAAGPALPQTGEAFVERFDGNLTKRWSISDGWSNGDWMSNDWRRSSVEVRPGLMSLHLKHGEKGSKHKLASGELQSHARHRYGYFEVRMKLPKGPGLVTGFFSYAGHQGKTRPNEIDIEILGRNTRVAELTIHENGKATSKKVELPFDAADGFHVYGFDWQPGFVRWYIDGRMVHEVTGGAAQRLVRPQQVILNLWASRQLEDWVGRLDLAKAPWRLDVSCVAYALTYDGQICS